MFKREMPVSGWVRLLCVAIVVSGCSRSAGPERFAVQGNVTVNGESLASGVIRFVPESSTRGPAAAGVIEQGAYSIPRRVGPIVGSYKIEIEQQPETDFAIDDEAGYAQAYLATKGRPIPPQPIPPRYNRQTELKANVTADNKSNTFDYHLEVKVGTAQKR